MRFAKWRVQTLCLSLLMATILVVGYLFLNWKSPSFFKTHPTVLHSRLEDGHDNNFPIKQHMLRGVVVGVGFGLGTLIKPRAYLHCGHGNRTGIMTIIALLSSNCCSLQVFLEGSHDFSVYTTRTVVNWLNCQSTSIPELVFCLVMMQHAEMNCFRSS